MTRALETIAVCGHTGVGFDHRGRRGWLSLSIDANVYVQKWLLGKLGRRAVLKAWWRLVQQNLWVAHDCLIEGRRGDAMRVLTERLTLHDALRVIRSGEVMGPWELGWMSPPSPLAISFGEALTLADGDTLNVDFGTLTLYTTLGDDLDRAGAVIGVERLPDDLRLDTGASTDVDSTDAEDE